jgi:hypothetical protein
MEIAGLLHIGRYPFTGSLNRANPVQFGRHFIPELALFGSSGGLAEGFRTDVGRHFRYRSVQFTGSGYRQPAGGFLESCHFGNQWSTRHLDQVPAG